MAATAVLICLILLTTYAVAVITTAGLLLFFIVSPKFELLVNRRGKGIVSYFLPAIKFEDYSLEKKPADLEYGDISVQFWFFNWYWELRFREHYNLEK